MSISLRGDSVSLFRLIFGDGTPRKAFLTALVVGSILTIINHGDSMMRGAYPPPLKVLLTYCVPYCVTTWGACTGKLAQMRRQKPDGPHSVDQKAGRQ